MNVAFVDSHGHTTGVAQYSESQNFTSGQLVGVDQYAVVLPPDMNADTLMPTKYYKNGTWLDRTAAPSEHHVWRSEAWVLDRSRLFLEIRTIRQQRLWDSDWTQMPDAPLSDSKKAEWATYRQALRDLPASVENITSLDQVEWPTKPS